MQTPRTEFAQALKAVATERGLDAEIILASIKEAIVAAYKRDARERGEEVEDKVYEVELDSASGEAKIFAWPAPEDIEEGDPNEHKDKKKDITPPGFGRIAAQTAKQVIHQKIREAEKDAVMDEFSGRVGGLISGMILRFDGPDVRVDVGRAEGLMPSNERVPEERLSSNQRYTFLLKEIVETPRGKQLILSRSDAQFVAKLFEREVPEMSSGSVEVKAIAREAGVRTKMAVVSNQSGVDPVGSCVGQKGVRVQAVTNELGGERVDIISWSDDTPELIKAALSPAESLTVSLDEEEKVANVQAPDDQLSLAIGKDGQNARLAAKLTGWKIEIEGDGSGEKEEDKEEPESAEEKAEKKEDVTEDTQADQKDEKAPEETEKEENEEAEKESAEAKDENEQSEKDAEEGEKDS